MAAAPLRLCASFGIFLIRYLEIQSFFVRPLRLLKKSTPRPRLVVSFSRTITSCRIDKVGLDYTCVDIMSQNLRGFKEDKEEEIILRMVERNLWAVCLQETWRIGDSTWENGGLTFIHHGLSEKPLSAVRLASRSSLVRKLGKRGSALARKYDTSAQGS